MHLQRRLATRRIGLILVWSSVTCLILAGSAEKTVLRVYGSEGPGFAIREAAIAFERQNRCAVEVVSGPPEAWLLQAQNQADLVYASAEFMMSAMIRDKTLEIDESSVTPLYLRPSAVLVRPGNPRQINDFPDLLKPGIRVMVVSGSGQTGLWEDMAGKTGDVQTVRTFRRNVVFFAANSTEAVKQWKEQPDIDAWVTWDIWQRPLHGSVHLVPVSEDFVIYRQCSIALTQRGRAHPLAAKFIDFLISPEGEDIFASWEWTVSRTPQQTQAPRPKRDSQPD